MRTICLFIALLALVAAPAAAQTFSSAPAAAISNALPPTVDTIVVAGGPTSIATLRVSIDITHTWVGDCDVRLTPPGVGALPIDLTIGNGGSNMDYTGTVFTGTADPCWVTTTPISTGAAPFTGLWLPDDTAGFDALYGTDGNGAWTLEITDTAGGDDGTLNTWSISFDGNPVPVSVTSAPGLPISFGPGPVGAPPTTDTITIGCPSTITALRVGMNITHTWDADLEIRLITPSGVSIDLSIGNGGSSDDFLGTVFTGTVDPCSIAAAGPISGGSAPFTGTFLPDNTVGFDAVYGTSNAGTWTLEITDTAGGDDGTLIDWTLDFTSSMHLSMQQNATDIIWDVKCGTPGAQFVLAFSFDTANGGAGLGGGPIYGLHVDIDTLSTQLFLGLLSIPPWGGNLDAAGDFNYFLPLTPGTSPFVGQSIYGLALELDPSFNVTATDLATHVIQ